MSDGVCVCAGRCAGRCARAKQEFAPTGVRLADAAGQGARKHCAHATGGFAKAIHPMVRAELRVVRGKSRRSRRTGCCVRWPWVKGLAQGEAGSAGMKTDFTVGRRARLQTGAARDVYVELPPEGHDEGRTGSLGASARGARDVLRKRGGGACRAHGDCRRAGRKRPRMFQPYARRRMFLVNVLYCS